MNSGLVSLPPHEMLTLQLPNKHESGLSWESERKNHAVAGEPPPWGSPHAEANTAQSRAWGAPIALGKSMPATSE